MTQELIAQGMARPRAAAPKQHLLTLEEFRGLGALCRPEDVARMSGQSLHNVQNKAHSGEIPTACKVAGKWRFNTERMGKLYGIISSDAE